jgi:hypothetical protein
MSFTGTTCLFAIPYDGPLEGMTFSSFEYPFDETSEHHVYTSSRNGALERQLQDICEQSTSGAGLYALRNFVVLQGEALVQAMHQLQALLAEIDADPQIVREATKGRHQPSITLQAEGFQPLQAEIVYPEDAVIEHGWVYYYAADQVRRLLRDAATGKDPQPPGDDDGESLQYVFGMLKSHLALLREAHRQGLTAVYARPSEDGV